jgi:hypothetical protein
LNIAACASASVGFYYPIFLTGFFAFLVFGFACLAVGAAFFLSDTTEFMEIYNKKIGLAELLFFGLAILVILAAVIFSGGLSTKAATPYNEHPWAVKNRNARNGILEVDKNFPYVKDSLTENEKNADVKVSFDSAKMPKLVK